MTLQERIVLKDAEALYIDPEGEPERAPSDDLMHLHNHVSEEEFNQLTEEELMAIFEKEVANPDPNYCDDFTDCNPDDWSKDRKELGLTNDDIHAGIRFVTVQEKLFTDIGAMHDMTDNDTSTKDQLNFK